MAGHLQCSRRFAQVLQVGLSPGHFVFRRRLPTRQLEKRPAKSSLTSYDRLVASSRLCPFYFIVFEEFPSIYRLKSSSEGPKYMLGMPAESRNALENNRGP